MDDMNAMTAYYEQIKETLERAFGTQEEAMETAAQMLADASSSGRNIFIFGCSHAGLLSHELCYRTGGMVTVNALTAPGLDLDITPRTMTSQMERLEGYGALIVDNSPMRKEDILIVHSVSGRNTVTVDVALRAKEKGVHVIVLTNKAYSESVNSRHPSGKKLMDLGEVVLDNCGVVGDASVEIEGIAERVAPTSTVVGAAMLNAVAARAIERIALRGELPPVFVSANVDGGDAHNEAVLERFKEHIFYM